MEIPVSLYIHFPWCLKKCPYCDFYSKTTDKIPQKEYAKALIADFKKSQHLLQNRKIESVFFGGGTPSLMACDSLETFLNVIFPFLKENAEITLEANPGAAEYKNFEFYKTIGINRISLGVQSFDDNILKSLGRIHSSKQAQNALREINKNFKNFNIDLMLVLPNQNVRILENDLKTALSFHPKHLSLYRLTIENGTAFEKNPPQLPDENMAENIELQAIQTMAENNFNHYEISAYAKNGFECRHNLNYWQFGDYLGIGVGAHSKITFKKNIFRFVRSKNIQNYLNGDFVLEKNKVENIPLEFLMNVFRLDAPFSFDFFEKRTGLKIESILKTLQQAENQKLITITDNQIQTTLLGKGFLNRLLLLFA